MRIHLDIVVVASSPFANRAILQIKRFTYESDTMLRLPVSMPALANLDIA
jgi:hypothetical protein